MQIHFISALLIGVSMFSSGVSASEFVRGELLIRVSEKGRAAGPAALSALHAKIGAKARSEFKLFQQFQVVKLPAGMSEEQGRKYYESSAAVEYAEPNFIYHTLEVQKDPLFEKQWGLHNTAQNSGKAGADIDALRAWKIERGNHQVVVAVIDSGVEYTHPDLQQNIWTNPHPGANGFEGDVHGWNFVEKNNDPKDDLFHGTHCAGIIGAAHNGIGVMGVAGEVSIMPVRFINASGGGTLEDSIKATEYAILRHSDILSNSWGGDDESQAMLEVIAKANDAGIVYVAAAGNEHNNNDTSPTYPASYNVPNVIAVAASTSSDEMAFFTNWGPTSVHLAAPGYQIFSTTPVEQNETMKAHNVAASYASLGGTSMAAPFVSGAAAVLKAHFPSMTPVQIKERLMATVDRVFGYDGLVASGGRLNLYNALKNITPAPIPDPDPATVVPYQLSTPHPYPELANLSYLIEHKGAKSIRVHFSRMETKKKVDFVGLEVPTTNPDEDEKTIETLTGDQGSLWSRPIPGDQVKIILRSDSDPGKYGFDIDEISFHN